MKQKPDLQQIDDALGDALAAFPEENAESIAERVFHRRSFSVSGQISWTDLLIAFAIAARTFGFGRFPEITALMLDRGKLSSSAILDIGFPSRINSALISLGFMVSSFVEFVE